MDTFTPAVDPSPGTGNTTSFSVYESKFGDGYSQRVDKGINPTRRTLSLQWASLTNTQANTIHTTLSAYGSEAFLYTPPTEATALKWVCRELSEQQIDSLGVSFSASLEQVFDI